MKIGLAGDGKITAVECECTQRGGAHSGYGVVTILYSGSMLYAIYDLHNVKYICKRVLTNTPPCGAFRGHGTVDVRFAFESLLDQMASELGLDPFVAVSVAIPILFIIGFALQRVLLNRTLGGDLLSPLLVTFGLSIIIQNGLLEIFSADSQRLRSGAIETASIPLGGGIAVGVVPLLTGSGAGAEMRKSLGTAVFSGMLGVTFFCIFFTPVFYTVIQRLREPRTQPAAPVSDASQKRAQH